MNTRNSEQFEKAGAQAAEVLGKFISVAAELGREFGGSPANTAAENSTTSEPSSEEVMREVGAKLREMREAAGYTLDGFSSALENEIKNESVAEKIDAVESGADVLPTEWAGAIAALLKSSDLSQLVDSLQNTGNPASDVVRPPDRVQQLAAIFAKDPDLDDMSDEKFEKLLSFVEGSYRQAKAVLKD